MVPLEPDQGRHNAKTDWGLTVQVGSGITGINRDAEAVLLLYWVWVYFCPDVCAVDTHIE